MYTSRKTTQDENSDYFLDQDQIPKLTEQQKQDCDIEITEGEVLRALKDMSNNKSPGSDGYPCEFYKFFWQDLGHFLVRSFQQSFRSNKLSIVQRQGVITCLPKGSKPRQFLKNWRPITLLNSDYKLLSAVIAKRMKIVLPDIISETQKGF